MPNDLEGGTDAYDCIAQVQGVKRRLALRISISEGDHCQREYNDWDHNVIGYESQLMNPKADLVPAWRRCRVERDVKEEDCEAYLDDRHCKQRIEGFFKGLIRGIKLPPEGEVKEGRSCEGHIDVDDRDVRCYEI